MPKHAPDDTFKCPLTVETPKKLVEENMHVVCGVPAKPELESSLETPQIEIKPEITRTGKIMLELDNLEDCAEAEKPVKIDLDIDLYQME